MHSKCTKVNSNLEYSLSSFSLFSFYENSLAAAQPQRFARNPIAAVHLTVNGQPILVTRAPDMPSLYGIPNDALDLENGTTAVDAIENVDRRQTSNDSVVASSFNRQPNLIATAIETASDMPSLYGIQDNALQHSDDGTNADVPTENGESNSTTGTIEAASDMPPFDGISNEALQHLDSDTNVDVEIKRGRGRPPKSKIATNKTVTPNAAVARTKSEMNKKSAAKKTMTPKPATLKTKYRNRPPLSYRLPPRILPYEKFIGRQMCKLFIF